MNSILAFVCICAFVQVILAEPEQRLGYNVFYSAVKEADGWKIIRGKHTDAPAHAIMKDTLDTNGWFILDVVTNSTFDDITQSEAAGYLEGAIGQPSIWNSWRNQFTNGSSLPYKFDPKVKDFLTKNDQWMRAQVKSATANKDFWNQVGLLLAQSDAVFAGYRAYAPTDQVITDLEWTLYQLNWDIGDIEASLSVMSTRPGKSEVPNYMGSHCSVLIKPSPNKDKLWTSHVTWGSFTGMLRVYKHYNMPLKSVKAPIISMSSYPGNLVSGDDFFVTSQQLTIMETTNDVFNKSLYQFTTTQTVPYWLRIMTANRLATNGQQWIHYGGLYNSGTYNNQYQIIDYKLFSPGKFPLVPNTVWIVEQIPGWWISNDVTSVINTQGYFPSYNIPMDKFVYDISGYAEMAKKHGNQYSYTECARARIFKREEVNVKTEMDFQKIMRYNKWQRDVESGGDACRGISARCDLNAPSNNNTYNGFSAFGATDCKYTTSDLIGSMKSMAVCGPTYDSQPIFWWSSNWDSVSHLGMPSVYHFPFVEMRPADI